MKDSEFLELLNLYLDHEITAADAARLEAEVQSNPNRRRIYQEYCRMQKACTLLAKDFADQPAERKVVEFEPRRSAWTPGLFASGGLAIAAACVALVLINRAPTNTTSTGASDKTIVAAPIPQPAPVAGEPATVISHTVTTVPLRRADVRPMLTTAPLMLAGAEQNAQPQFEWMKNVQLVPIQQLPMEELRLDPRSSLQPASRTYSNGHPVQGTVEMTAFRFQR